MVIKSKKNTKRVRTLKQETKRGGGKHGHNEEEPPPPYNKIHDYPLNTPRMTLSETLGEIIKFYKKIFGEHINQRHLNNIDMKKTMKPDVYEKTYGTKRTDETKNNVSLGYYDYYMKTGKTLDLHKQYKSLIDYKAFLDAKNKSSEA
jgi:hypothetical protein